MSLFNCRIFPRLFSVLLLIFPGIGKADTHSVDTCDDFAILADAAPTAKLRILTGTYALETSFGGLRTLNELFKNSGVPQTLVNLFHFIFHTEWRAALVEKNVSGTARLASRYLKDVSGVINTHHNSLTDIAAAEAKAKEATLKRLLLYFKLSIESGNNLGRVYEEFPGVFIGDSQSMIAYRKKIFEMLFQGDVVIEALLPGDAEIVQEKFIQQYGSLEKALRFFLDQYGVSIGPTRADAAHGTKRIQEGRRSFQYIDFPAWRRDVKDALAAKTELAPYLDLLRDDALGDFFTNLRKTLSTGQQDHAWLQRTAKDSGFSTDKILGEGRKLSAAMGTFAYLDPAWFRPLRDMERQFDAFGARGFIVSFDVKGLGGRGMTAVYKSLNIFASHVEDLDKAIKMRQIANDQQRAETTEVLNIKMEALRDHSLKVLAPVNEFLNETVSKMLAIIEAEIPGAIYREWRTGDEGFIRVKATSPSDRDRVLKRLTKELGMWLRFGAMDVEQGQQLPLTRVRGQLGQVFEVLKAEEERDLRSPFYALLSRQIEIIATPE